MNLNEAFDVSPGKLAALKERIVRLKIDTRLIEESFTRGGGKGGQKVNKSNNAVQLKYPPLELVVRCHRERRRTVNRFLALRELVDRIEMRVSPGTSERLKEIDRLRKRKARKGERQLRQLRELRPGTASGLGGCGGGRSCAGGPAPEGA